MSAESKAASPKKYSGGNPDVQRKSQREPALKQRNR